MSDDSVRVQDLTQPMAEGTYVYEDGDYSDPEFECAIHAAVDGTPDTAQVSTISMGSHTGTHVDAPRHYYPDGDTITDFDVGTFRFDAVVVDVRDTAAANEPLDADLDAVDLAAGGLVVFRTGWDRYWDDPAAYGANPFLSAATVRACADRGYHVGVDAPSPDPVVGARDGAEVDSSGTAVDDSGTAVDNDLYAHAVLLGEGLLLVENLTNLGAVPDDESFVVHAYPLPVVGGDGSPVRAVGVWEG